MRHRVRGRKLGRTTAHRKALFRNQLTALFTHERIITTVAKAKELRPIAERMVTLARTGTLPARRRVLTMVPDKIVVRRLFDEIAPRFMDRNGGYTRIVRLGNRRGDGAELALIEFVDYVPSAKGEGGGEKKASLMDRARGMFGGRKEGAPEGPAEAETVEVAGEEPAEEIPAEAAVEEAAEEPAEVTKPKRARKTAKKKAEPAAKEAKAASAAEEPAAEAEPAADSDENAAEKE